MISSLSHTPLSDPAPLLSQDRLRSLAQTYNRADSPVWIHDLKGDCIYNNAPAERLVGAASPLVFDILDYHGRVIGRLKTIAN